LILPPFLSGAGGDLILVGKGGMYSLNVEESLSLAIYTRSLFATQKLLIFKADFVRKRDLKYGSRA
ncbi:hypothetical protein QT972_15695, partial [Microcoleus sp. herbarium7]|uniref:hypothetical protein n=1 Tax=Microcoleus sp. herbarium7 TaxID=3055435 RepID=UPI002FCF74FA